MPKPSDTPVGEISFHFSAESVERWRLLLRHFSLSDDFAFIVVLVPGQEASKVCAHALESFFRDMGKRLVKMLPKTPNELQEFVAKLVTFEPDSSVGALWVSAAVPETDPEHPAWARAWQELAAQLNLRRDIMRFRVRIPLIFVGTPWLKLMLRETAPDLWSVRTLAVEMSWRPPEASDAAQTGDAAQIAALDWLDNSFRASSSDAELALAEAEGLRKRITQLAQGESPLERSLTKDELETYKNNLKKMLARLLQRAGAAFLERGKLQEAEPLLREALEIQRQLNEVIEMALSLETLAHLYDLRGERAKALPLVERALAMTEAALGSAHPQTARLLNNLAKLRYEQGAYEEASPLLERALAIHERALGAEHPDTATVLSNLAGLYRAQGANEQALLLHERALAIRERTLGVSHPDLAADLNRLATLYHAQGDYEKALPLYERALAIRERALGANHPATTEVLESLARLHTARGDKKRASQAMERRLAAPRAAQTNRLHQRPFQGLG